MNNDQIKGEITRLVEYYNGDGGKSASRSRGYIVASVVSYLEYFYAKGERRSQLLQGRDEVENLLSKNNAYNGDIFDTYDEAFNLNRDFIKSVKMDFYVNSLYLVPCGWNVEDVVKLNEIELNGRAIVLAFSDMK